MKKSYQKNGWFFAFVFATCFFFTAGLAHATTYYSDYGVSRTHNITVIAGTHSFQVDGIAQYKNTEWYVNGVYTGESENDWSGSLAIDPEYTRSFSSGTTKIEAVVYDRYWNYEERHIWNVTVAKPDLIAYGISVSDTTVDPGQSVTVYWTAKNDGTASCGSTQQGVMWSTNNTISRSDTWLENEYLGGLSPGQSTPEAHTITIPGNATPGSTYYIGIIADYDYDEDESNESNNDDGTPVAVTINAPDLVVTDILMDGQSSLPDVPAWQNVRLDFDVLNQGDAATIPDVHMKWWWGTSQNAMSNEIATGSLGTINGLSPGESERETDASWIIPQLSPGTYWITAKIDWDDRVDESDENNNVRSEAFTVSGSLKSGRIVSCSPSDFYNAARIVTVRVQNTATVGYDAGMIIKCDATTSGWSVTPSQIIIVLDSGEYYNAHFTVDPPNSYDSGQITWKLYYDEILPFPDTLLDTKVQTVTNTPPVPTVAITASDPAAGEPANNGYFTVSRTGSTSGSLRVYYGTSGSTATSGSDYAALPGYVDIPSGQSSALISVVVIDDSQVESSETVKVTLSSNSAYNIGSPSNATVTIADNDVATYTLTVNSSGASGVSISSSTGHGGTTNYTKSVSSGTSVTLTAPSTASGKTFTGWTGSVTSGSQTITFSMTGNKTVTANYVTSTYYALTTSVIGGNGTLSPPSGTYGEGTVVTLTAVPDPGYRVKAWSGTDDDSSKANTNTVTMNSNKSVTVEFEIGQEDPIGWNLMNFDLHNSDLYPYPSEVRVQDVPFTEQWTGVGTTMKTGDIDGDGVLELVTSDGSNLYVYDGNGQIEWQMALSASLSILADVTGDDTLEIIVSIKDGATGRIEAYDGSGPGSPVKTFTTSVHLDYGGVTARGVTDLDEDGVNELIATKGAAWVQGRGVVIFDCNTTSELWYYDVGPFVPYPAVGDVAGLLTDKEILHGSSGPANGVTGADGSNDSSCYAFLLDATGSSLWRKQFEGSGFVNASVGLCDVDGDGILDVIATSFSHGTSFWTGSLGRVYILDPTTGEPISGYEHNFSTAVTLGGFADLDEDGTPEILVNKKDGAIQTGSVMALSPAAGLPVVNEFAVSGSALDVLFINDLNGDGKLEVIVKGTPADGPDHTLYVLDNELNLLWSIVPGGSIQAIVSDLDEDGMNEIILSDGSDILVFQGEECVGMSGDFDDDCDVDFVDLKRLVENWLWTGTPGGIDEDIAPQPDGDGMVNFLDFAIFAEDWLVGFVPDPPEPEIFYELTLDTNPGWTTEGLWAFGQPTGDGGAYGGPDPTTGYTGINVYGYNLAGDYENSLSETHLTSTAIDCSGHFNIHLKFWRWLGVEQPLYDHAYVQVSNNGTNWTTIWQNTGQVADTSWVQVDINISSVADEQSVVYLRWTMGSTDSSWTFCGWNIDDIELWGNE